MDLGGGHPVRLILWARKSPAGKPLITSAYFNSRAAGLSSAAPAWKYPMTLATDRCSVIAITAGSGTPCLPASVTKPERKL